MLRWFEKLKFSRRVILGLAFIGLATVMLVSLVPARVPPVLVLDEPVRFPQSVRDRLTSWIPQSPGWSWIWRIESAIFGKRKPVNLFAEVMSLKPATQDQDSEFSLTSPTFTAANGLKVWFLSAEQLKALRDVLKQTGETDVLSRPRISTADGIESRLLSGQSVMVNGTTRQLGMAVACLARVHRDSVDLFASLRFSELVTNQPPLGQTASSSPAVAVQTNLDTSLRVQLPKGQGLFLIDGAHVRADRRRFATLIDPPVR